MKRAEYSEPETKAREVELTPVKSSNVKAVGWASEAGGILVVEFLNGSKYGYLKCPSTELTAALKAPSVGKYISGHIKANYAFVKLS